MRRVLGAAAALLFSATAADAVLPMDGDSVFLGAGACASPLCHGGGQGGRVRLDEYLIWHERDAHAGAYDVLRQPRGKRIAENLGIRKPEEDPLCLDCHAANVPQDRRKEGFQISDGVTCEVCHGGAGGWIESHRVLGTERRQNLERGMFPTDDVAARAELCLSCHLGTAKKLVTHRMMAAGHPRVSFELDTFTQLQPAHFDVDPDYRERGKQALEAVKAWAVGELVTARQYLELLALRVGDGRWPEFALFDCFSCHQEIRDPLRSKDVVAVQAALPRLRTHSLAASLDVLRVAAPALAPTYERTLAALSADASRGRYGGDAGGQGYAGARAALGEGIPLVALWTPQPDEVRRLARVMTGRYAQLAPLSYFHADQGTMAVQAITATLFSAGPDPAAQKALESLFATTEEDADFDPDRFRAAMSVLDGALSRSAGAVAR